MFTPTTRDGYDVALDHYGATVADYVRDTYPAVLPLLAEGWTLESAMNHVQGMCDWMLCTGEHPDA